MFTTMGYQGFDYYNTDNPYSAFRANSPTTTISFHNITMYFSIPMYNPGYRTGSITVKVENHRKTINIVQAV